MKHVLKIALGLLLLMPCIVQAQFVTIRGKQFIDSAGNPFFLKMININANIVCNDSANPTKFRAIRHMQYGTKDCLLEPVSRYNSIDSCERSLEDDFAKIDSMGFNSIRFLLIPRRNSNTNNLGGFNLPAPQFNNTLPKGLCTTPVYQMKIGPGGYDDTTKDAQKYFKVMARVMDLAQAHHLKVIIICGDHPLPGTYTVTNSHNDTITKFYPEMGSSQTDANDYAAYLYQLAKVLKNKPALMAYDIFPEPNFSWSDDGRDMWRTKMEVCKFTTMWYDTIKAADPNHLVTLSGTDIGDPQVWDEGVMKLDFLSMHLYPYKSSLSRGGSDTAIQKIKDQIYWCTNALERPWILGETGFSATHESCMIPYVWGDEAAQKAYMHNILPAVRDCGAAGFNIWDYQDVHFYCVPDTVCPNLCDNCDDYSDTSATNHKGWCGYDLNSSHSTYKKYDPNQVAFLKTLYWGQYFGMLKYVDPDQNGIYPSSGDKPAVAIIKGLDTISSGSCGPSAYYYNPERHPSNPTDLLGNSTKIQGTVVDPNGGVPNAVVWGTTLLRIDGNNNHFLDLHYTFTQSDGSFTLLPYDYDPRTPNSNNITMVRITAVGANTMQRNDTVNINRWDTTGAIFTNGQTYNITRNVLKYTTNVSSSPPSGSSSYQGFGILNVSGTNIVTPSGSAVDYKARDEVDITPGFTATAGSEVHIYNAETFSECQDFSTYARTSGHGGANASNNQQQDDTQANIEVNFKKKTTTNLDFVIQPNPNNGKFTVVITQGIDAGKFNGGMRVYSFLGQEIYSQQTTTATNIIDFSGLAPGVYYMQIKTDANMVTKKFIIQ